MCQSVIQQINHHALSHTADVDGYCVIDALTTTITKSITAKSDDITGQKLQSQHGDLVSGKFILAFVLCVSGQHTL